MGHFAVKDFFCFPWTIPCKGKAFMHVKFFCTFFSKFFNLTEPRSGDIFVRAKMAKYSSTKDACRRHIYYIGLTSWPTIIYGLISNLMVGLLISCQFQFPASFDPKFSVSFPHNILIVFIWYERGLIIF